MQIPGLRRANDAADASSALPLTNVRQIGPVKLTLPNWVADRLPPDANAKRARVRGKNGSKQPLSIADQLKARTGKITGAIKGVGKFQETLMTNMAVKVIAGVSGTLSGLLLAGLAYKVVGGYQDEMKEARREVQKQAADRKARLANVRRLLSGPLRAAAKDLRDRIEDILKTPPRRKLGEPPSIRANYFAAHYPDNPSEAVNSTLFRLCRYLHWVEQFQRGVQLEGVSEQDTWQYALDIELDRVAKALSSSDDRYDATVPTERLTEIFATAHALERRRRIDEESDEEFTPSIFQRVDSTFTRKKQKELEQQIKAAKMAKRAVASREVAEPRKRISRFPMRVFRDSQVAVAEVFGKLNIAQAEGTSVDGKVTPHMLYTEFVMKLEDAQLLLESAEQDKDDPEAELPTQQEAVPTDPWFRWMLPLQLQIRRIAMLQSQTSKLLTRKEARELLAARARMRGILEGLNGLLRVLERRLDDPMFNKPKKNIGSLLANAQERQRARMLETRRRTAIAGWAKIRQSVPYVAKFHRLPPPPLKKRYLGLMTTDDIRSFIRNYKRQAIASVATALTTHVVSTVIAAVGVRQNNKRRAKNDALAAPPLPTVISADAPSESDKSPITMNVSTEVENTQAGTRAGNATSTKLKGKTSQTKKEQASKKECLPLKK